jgi:hypothetical protein
VWRGGGGMVRRGSAHGEDAAISPHEEANGAIEAETKGRDEGV